MCRPPLLRRGTTMIRCAPACWAICATVVLALAACTSTPPASSPVANGGGGGFVGGGGAGGRPDPCDKDGDGFRDPSCGGDDCNDRNATVHPGATELCSG